MIGFRSVVLSCNNMLTEVTCLVVLLLVPTHAENVELTSDKERRFTCPGDQVIFTCRVFGSSSLEWRSLLITQTTSYVASATPPMILNRDPLTVSLISVSGIPLNANFTSTLQVTASRMIMRDATTVMCLSTTASKTDNFTVAEIPTVPLLNVVVDRAASVFGVGSSIVIRFDWMRPENFDQFDIDHYDISVNSTSGEINLTLVCGECTSTVITLSETPSNMQVNTTFNTTIAAVNQCGETGPTATASYTLIDCGSPVAPQNGTVANHTSTTNGTVIFYSCDPGLVPVGRMRAVCTGSGWSPNPADLNCTEVNCGMPIARGNGSIVAIPNTLGGTKIIFRCNTGFVPTGNMAAVCTSDGISPNGTWTPNPATLVCIARNVDCGDPPTLASGVAVEAYTSTAVNSDIIFQCQQPGLVPSYRSATCGSDRRWSPDPSQVECRMITPAPTGTPPESTPTGATVPTSTPVSTGSSDAPSTSCSTNVAIAAVVSCAVSFIIAVLVGAVVHYCTVRKKCDCQKFYSLTIPRKKQQQQPAPVYDDIVGQSQNIELKENVAYGPVQQ